VRVQRAKLGCG
jgi:adenosine kinase